MKDPIDRGVYPIDPWRLIEVGAGGSESADTLFTVSNGYVGLRGIRDEDIQQAACYVNGFYESWPLRYPETAYGLAREGQAIQAVPSPTQVSLTVGGQRLGGQPISQRRELDMAGGVLTRRTVWPSPRGQVIVDARRLVSLTRRGLVASRITVTPVDGAVELGVAHSLALPAPKAVEAASCDPRGGSLVDGETVVAQASVDGDRLVMDLRTPHAGAELTMVVDHCLQLGSDIVPPDMAAVGDGEASTNWWVNVPAGQSVTLDIMAWYGDGGASLNEAVSLGWGALAAEQRRWLDGYWARADIIVDDPGLQQAIRWNTFQAIQASARADGQGIGAKGLSGAGYDGHYFWDMEMYVLPLLTYTAPKAARAALEFRRRTLPQAVERARELHLAGALYPWRTINGREASAYYEAGTAQYHIDADIAHALTRYVAATGDEEFMTGGGLDILVQTARMWASRGFWGDDGYWHVHYVTGPDEYTALVNDNLFTNLMARNNLHEAAAAVEKWGGDLANQIADELVRWRHIADGVFVPYDPHRGIYPQNAGFLQLEPWDLSGIPPENFPLLLHYHPLSIYRHQVIKQADVVLAQILCPDDFTPQQKLANFDFYDSITTGDSTLSAVPQAIGAAEVGHLDLAVEYLMQAAYVDLADLHKNAYYGVHLAVAAGVWNALVMGFGGMRDNCGHLSLWPRLPDGWAHLKFSLLVRGSQLRVEIEPDQVRLSVSGATPIDLTVWGHSVTVTPNSSEVIHQ